MYKSTFHYFTYSIKHTCHYVQSILAGLQSEKAKKKQRITECDATFFLELVSLVLFQEPDILSLCFFLSQPISQDELPEGQLLERIELVLQAVKEAREAANMAEAVTGPGAGPALFGFLYDKIV